MALVFSKFSFDEIVELSGKEKPEVELEKLSFEELELLNNQISNLILKVGENNKKYDKIMALRAYIVMMMWYS